jgi:BMFP domain-containing protein YqiC
MMMINPAKIEEIAKQISGNLPKTKQAIQNKLAEMDFVSREEFDIQSKVLIRTREKLAELEAKVAEIEAKLDSDKHAE